MFALGKYPFAGSELLLMTSGVSRSPTNRADDNEGNMQLDRDYNNALLKYQVFFQWEIAPNEVGILNELYTKVLQCSYGNRATEVHPFILAETNPLYLLIRINVILMGSPFVAFELIGRVRLLQQLRAACATLAFRCLETALRRNALDASSTLRQDALVVHTALLLEQVIECRGDIPAATIACTQSETHEEMRLHLIQYLSCYLFKLTKTLFEGASPLMECIEIAARRGHVGEELWDILSKMMPSIPLRKSPMIRKYADLGWGDCVDEDGHALHEFFSSHCSLG
jgi:hypothetical protein